MRPLVDCTITETNSEISREEQGKEIFFRHPEFDMVCNVVSIDDCVFRNTRGQKRCDYLFLFDKNLQQYRFLHNSPSIAFYVELKGIDLVHACEQLLNSIEKTMAEIRLFDIHAVVVSSRRFIPQYDNNEFYRGVKRLIRKNIQFEITPHIINL
jgi:hypothetical protein